MNDELNLGRFVSAQQDIYPQALAELCAGDKQSHWMWFIFPQIEGLGRSPTARRYAIKSLAEAEAYLAHPLLGPRLRECCQALLEGRGHTAHQILGSPDDMKLKSSMTLFSVVAGQKSPFMKVLQRYYGGELDSATLEILAKQDG